MNSFLKTKAKWILLDAMGVVYKVGDDTNDLLIPFIQSKNDRIDRHEIQSRYLEASLGKISSGKFWELLGFENQFPDIEKYYLDNFVQSDEEVSEFLQLFRSVGYKIAMLSNDVSEWSFYLRRKFNIEQYFSQVIISGDVKMRKPDIDIFYTALSKLNADPKNCIFVDDREKNLESAFSLGFNTVFFDRANIGASKIGQIRYIDFYVTNFRELILTIKNHFELDN